MHSRRGSIIVIASLVIGAVIIVGVLMYKFMLPNSGYLGIDLPQDAQIPAEMELTKSDEISDIEMDLNSTNVDSLDAEVSGVTSEVE